MAIRPRKECGWHDYSRVFQDLRDGRLSYPEYAIMIEEDRIEMERRLEAEARLDADALFVKSRELGLQSRQAYAKAVKTQSEIDLDSGKKWAREAKAKAKKRYASGKMLCAPSPFLERENAEEVRLGGLSGITKVHRGVD